MKINIRESLSDDLDRLEDNLRNMKIGDSVTVKNYKNNDIYKFVKRNDSNQISAFQNVLGKNHMASPAHVFGWCKDSLIYAHFKPEFSMKESVGKEYEKFAVDLANDYVNYIEKYCIDIDNEGNISPNDYDRIISDIDEGYIDALEYEIQDIIEAPQYNMKPDVNAEQAIKEGKRLITRLHQAYSRNFVGWGTEPDYRENTYESVSSEKPVEWNIYRVYPEHDNLRSAKPFEITKPMLRKDAEEYAKSKYNFIQSTAKHGNSIFVSMNEALNESYYKLCWYSPGDGEIGIGGDKFDTYAVVKAIDLKDAKDQFKDFIMRTGDDQDRDRIRYFKNFDLYLQDSEMYIDDATEDEYNEYKDYQDASLQHRFESLKESTKNSNVIDFLKNIKFGDEFYFLEIGDWEISAWMANPRYNFPNGSYAVQLDNDKLNKHFVIPDNESEEEFEYNKDQFLKRRFNDLVKGYNESMNEDAQSDWVDMKNLGEEVYTWMPKNILCVILRANGYGSDLTPENVHDFIDDSMPDSKAPLGRIAYKWFGEEKLKKLLRPWIREESLKEDTVKTKDGKWTNKGDEGTHGKFRTKKEADAQRRAMFANGYHESLNEGADLDAANRLEDDGWTILSHGIYSADRKNHYWLARKVMNGKGCWKAINSNTGEVIDITYKQAIGDEPIGEYSGVTRLSKDLGKKLLSVDESLNEEFYFDYMNYNDYIANNFDGWGDDIDDLIHELNVIARAMGTRADKLIFYIDYDEEFWCVDDLAEVVQYVKNSDASIYQMNNIKFACLGDGLVWAFKGEKDGAKVVSSVEKHCAEMDEDLRESLKTHNKAVKKYFSSVNEHFNKMIGK